MTPAAAGAPATLPADVRAALADDLDLLARLHDREPDADLVAALRREPPERWFALRLTGEDFDEGCRLVRLALAEMPDPVDRPALDELAAEFSAIYLTFAYRVAPTESVWVDEDGLERQAAMFAVRQWYRRFGYAAPDWRRRADDHLAFELQGLALALRAADDAEPLRAVAAFLREHPLVWVPAFAARLARRCRSPFYAGIALLTVAHLVGLARLIGELLGEDMAPRPPAAAAARAGGATCADPPPAHVPGAAPGW